MRGGKFFSGQVSDPFTELVVTRREKAATLTVEGMPYIEGDVAVVALVRETWWI